MIKDAYSDAFKSPKSHVFYSEPSSRRESVTSSFCNSSSPVPPVANYLPPEASPNTPSPPSRRLAKENVSSNVPNMPMQRSTSAENMKLESEHKADVGHKTYDANYLSKLSKNPYSTLPHNSKTMRQIQKHLENSSSHEEKDKEKIRRYVHSEMKKLSQSLMDEQLAAKAMSTPSSPIINFKSSSHSTNNSPPISGVKFGKTFFWLRKNKRAASAPELGERDSFTFFRLSFVLLAYFF